MARHAVGGPRLDAVHAIIGEKHDARAGDGETVGMARAGARLQVGEQRRPAAVPSLRHGSLP